MANAVVIKSRVEATDVASKNISMQYTADVNNGIAVTKGAMANTLTGNTVYTAVLAQSGLTFTILGPVYMPIAGKNMLTSEVKGYKLEVKTNTANIYMAHSPEVSKDVVGNVLAGIDPRNFTNLAGKPFDAFKLEVGDTIDVTNDFFSTAPVTGNNTVTLTAGAYVPSTV